MSSGSAFFPSRSSAARGSSIPSVYSLHQNTQIEQLDSQRQKSCSNMPFKRQQHQPQIQIPNSLVSSTPPKSRPLDETNQMNYFSANRSKADSNLRNLLSSPTKSINVVVSSNTYSGAMNKTIRSSQPLHSYSRSAYKPRQSTRNSAFEPFDYMAENQNGNADSHQRLKTDSSTKQTSNQIDIFSSASKIEPLLPKMNLAVCSIPSVIEINAYINKDKESQKDSTPIDSNSYTSPVNLAKSKQDNNHSQYYSKLRSISTKAGSSGSVFNLSERSFGRLSHRFQRSQSPQNEGTSQNELNRSKGTQNNYGMQKKYGRKSGSLFNGNFDGAESPTGAKAILLTEPIQTHHTDTSVAGEGNSSPTTGVCHGKFGYRFEFISRSISPNFDREKQKLLRIEELFQESKAAQPGFVSDLRNMIEKNGRQFGHLEYCIRRKENYDQDQQETDYENEEEEHGETATTSSTAQVLTEEAKTQSSRNYDEQTKQQQQLQQQQPQQPRNRNIKKKLLLPKRMPALDATSSQWKYSAAFCKFGAITTANASSSTSRTKSESKVLAFKERVRRDLVDVEFETSQRSIKKLKRFELPPVHERRLRREFPVQTMPKGVVLKMGFD